MRDDASSKLFVLRRHGFIFILTLSLVEWAVVLHAANHADFPLMLLLVTIIFPLVVQAWDHLLRRWLLLLVRRQT